MAWWGAKEDELREEMRGRIEPIVEQAYEKAEGEGFQRGYGAVYDDETRKLARDLLIVYAQGGFEPRKEDVQNIVRAARWLMEEWRNPTPDPPPSPAGE